jgi:glucose-6-phosphate isomerase
MTFTLAQKAGLPIQWNMTRDDLVFDSTLVVKEIKSRARGALRPVLPDDAACAPADATQYWMYNGVAFPEHLAAFARLNIQYELTLIYPARLGTQHSKTLGHIHTFPAQGRYNYPEVCEIVYGEALFLCQTLDVEDHSSSFCYAVHAKAGDKIVFSPNMHHLTINPLDDMLLFSDLISLEVRGNYTGLSAMQGGAYLFAEGGWHPNPTYDVLPSLLHFEAPEYPELGLTRDVPLYELIWRAPEMLEWLDKPEAFGATFPDLWSKLPAEVTEGEKR